jgi:RNA polymerase sigma-70 factor (ECF subfamily)
MGGHAPRITPEYWEVLRRKLITKVRFQVGNFCSDIEDLVQESLARFQRALNDETVRKPESAAAFLSGVCNNVILEYRRRLCREVPYDSELHPQPQAASTAHLVEIRNAIDAAMSQLNDRDRKVLMDFYLKERSKDEICREMGITDAQFRVIIFRAKDRMRRLLS